MSLAIFDLDNTLIADDSDYLWGQFLVNQGLVNAADYEAANAKFYKDYREGILDIVEFLHFSLKPLAQYPAEQLYEWRTEFVHNIIKPLLLEPAQQLINQHRVRGDTVLVITATNRFVTEPIVQLYGIELLLATTPEFIEGRYTGKFIGTPCFQAGKVKHLYDWLAHTQESLVDSCFYSDSHNDLPMLSLVDNPVAVDSDPQLAVYAEAHGWPVISLRQAGCPVSHWLK